MIEVDATEARLVVGDGRDGVGVAVGKFGFGYGLDELSGTLLATAACAGSSKNGWRARVGCGTGTETGEEMERVGRAATKVGTG